MPQSSRLVLLEKFLANNFVFSDVEDSTSVPLNRGGMANLTLLRILLSIRKMSRDSSFWELMDSFVLLAYTSLAASRTLLQRLLDFLYFGFRRCTMLVETEKVISMNYGSSTNSWKLWRWMRLDLILTMRNICISSNLNPLTKLTKFTEVKDTLTQSISQMITKTIPISTRIVISYLIGQKKVGPNLRIFSQPTKSKGHL